MLSAHLEAVSARNAARIWGFMSKFVMLDRLSALFGAAEICPGLRVLKTMCSSEYLGTGAKVTYFP
jgi:hypothetical protein